MNVREALGFHVFERIIWHIRTPFISPASVWRAGLVGHRGPIDEMVSNIAICRAYGREIGQNNDNAECLTKDRDALLTFYDFPAEHWKHLRTTNPIEALSQPHDPLEGLPV